MSPSLPAAQDIVFPHAHDLAPQPNVPDLGLNSDLPTAAPAIHSRDLPSQSKRARVEDVPDDDLEAGSLPKDPFIKRYPRPAGTKLRQGQNLFERIHAMRTEIEAGGNPWAPYESEDEWYLARFLLMSGMSHSDIDRYLKLDIVRTSIYIACVLLKSLSSVLELDLQSY